MGKVSFETVRSYLKERGRKQAYKNLITGRHVEGRNNVLVRSVKRNTNRWASRGKFGYERGRGRTHMLVERGRTELVLAMTTNPGNKLEASLDSLCKVLRERK